MFTLLLLDAHPLPFVSPPFPCEYNIILKTPCRYDNGHPDLPVLAAGSPCGDGLCGDGFTPIGVDLATYGVWNVDGHGHGKRKKEENASFANWYLIK